MSEFWRAFPQRRHVFIHQGLTRYAGLCSSFGAGWRAPGCGVAAGVGACGARLISPWLMMLAGCVLRARLWAAGGRDADIAEPRLELDAAREWDQDASSG